jgi:hypothetical protein
MQLTSLSQELLARLLKLGDAASHASVLAAVADNAAWLAHQRADAAQAVLSAVKIFVALLPDHTTRELWPSGLSVERPVSCSGSVHSVTRESLTPGHFAGSVRPGPTVRPASLPPAGQAGRRQFGLDRGHRGRWRLETLQGHSTPGADHGI